MDRDEHRRLQELLPWYVTGRLDAAERAEVAIHLEACDECQAEVRMEKRLEAEVARLPLDVERGWALMRRQLEGERPRAAARPGPGWRAPWVGWSVAAALVVVVGVSWAPQAQPERYHALGEAPAAASQSAGNIVVVFLPETTERQMREALKASQARLVDGPTVTNGYVLRVEPVRRTAALAALRAEKAVVVAEPLDGAP